MAAFLYTVWFRDPALLPDDQDHEWPACLHIIAETAEVAQRWGDTLARRRAARLPALIFLKSAVEPSEHEDLPLVTVGEDAEDTRIGW